MGAPDERRVPPRTPPQRLHSLCNFAEDYIISRVQAAELLNRPTRGDNMIGRLSAMCTAMSDTYEKRRTNTPSLRRCSYFDPLVLPNGGPRPLEERRRRFNDEFDWIEATLEALDAGNKYSNIN